MKKVLFLALMLTGSFAFANNFEPVVFSETKEENASITQSDVLYVQGDVSYDYQYQIDDSFSESQADRCFLVISKTDDKGGATIVIMREIPCDSIVIVVIRM